jgi:hypothetical protein
MSCNTPSGLPIIGCCGGSPLPYATGVFVRVVSSVVGYNPGGGGTLETVYRTVAQTFYVNKGGPEQGVAHMTMNIDDNNVETLVSYDEDAKFVFYFQRGALVTSDPPVLSGAKPSKTQAGVILDGILASIPYRARPKAGEGVIHSTLGTYYYGSRGLETQFSDTTPLEDGVARFSSPFPDFVPFVPFNGPFPGVLGRIGARAAYNHWRSKGWFWSASNEVNLECMVLYGGSPYSETCEGVNLGPLPFNTSTGREMACPSDRLNYAQSNDLWTRTVRPKNQMGLFACCLA